MLSRNFRLQKVGNLDWLQHNYNFAHISFYIDELVILDVSRGARDFDLFCGALKKLTEGLFQLLLEAVCARSIKLASCCAQAQIK